jgi:hypothetical protein
MNSQRQQADHFDLLPFIAVLLCLLGFLLLVAMSVASLRLGSKEGWIVDNDMLKMERIPVLVEWDGSNLVIHRANDQRQTISISDDMQSSNLAAFCTEMSDQSATHYILFAVRPSGFGSFNYVANLFRKNDIRVGYEPIMQDRQVDLMTLQSNKLVQFSIP